MEEDIVNNLNKNPETEKAPLSVRKLEALKGARQAKQVKKEYIETFNTAYLYQLDNIHTNLQTLNKQINTITAYIGNKEEVTKKRKIIIEEDEEEEEPEPPKKKKIIAEEKNEEITIGDNSVIGAFGSYKIGQAIAVGGSAIALFYLRAMTTRSVKKDHDRYEKCDF